MTLTPEQAEIIAYSQAQGQMFAKVGAGDTAVQGDMLLPANAALTGAEGVRVEGTVRGSE